jgi:formate hydrogenlyase subunit 6/NADH:ubiquinone oxidoreductase subunit I
MKAKNALPPANENHNPYKIRLGTRTGLKDSRMLIKSIFRRTFSVTAPVEWKPSDDVYEGDAPSSPMAVDDIYYRLPKMPNFHVDYRKCIICYDVFVAHTD